MPDFGMPFPDQDSRHIGQKVLLVDQRTAAATPHCQVMLVGCSPSWRPVRRASPNSSAGRRIDQIATSIAPTLGQTRSESFDVAPAKVGEIRSSGEDIQSALA